MSVFLTSLGQLNLPSSNSPVPTSATVQNQEPSLQTEISSQIELFSSEHALKLAQLSDLKLLKELLTLIEHPGHLEKFKHFSTYPALTAKLDTLPLADFGEMLPFLLNFLEKNAQHLFPPFIQTFISKQLVKIQICFHLNKNYKEKRYFPDFTQDATKMSLERLLLQSHLPKQFHEPLRSLNESFRGNVHFSVTPLLNKGKVVPTESRCTYHGVLELAVRTSNEIEGTDSRGGGIRMWVHQPTSQKNGGNVGILLKKTFEEFQSGRRKFYFKSIQGQVPFCNYKEVMLYVIRVLKEDRLKYYLQHPDYINPKTYDACALQLESKGFCEDIVDPRYPFEWSSRKLIALEEEVLKSQTDKEITLCLRTFSKYYFTLRNPNMELTVCSCISSGIFDSDSQYKPLLTVGIPPNLSELLDEYKLHDRPPLEVLNVFSSLINQALYHPQAVQDSLKEMQNLHALLIQDPGNKDLMRQFLRLWYAIPSSPMLLEKLELPLKQTLLKFIKNLEIQFGVCKSVLEQLLKFKQMSNHPGQKELNSKLDQLQAKYPSVFDLNQFHPEATHAQLTALKQELDSIKNQCKNEIALSSHWISEFSERLNELLSYEPNPLNVPDINFVSLANNAKYILLFPLLGVSEKVFLVSEKLAQLSMEDTKSVAAFYQSLATLKNFIFEKMLNNPEFSDNCCGAVQNALKLIESFEIGIVSELIKDHECPERMALAIRIAFANGYVNQECQDAETVKKALENERQERLAGYTKLRKWIVNTPKVLKRLEEHRVDVDDYVQSIQTLFNSGMAACFDRSFPQQNMPNTFSGHPICCGEAIGRLRFIPSDSVFEAAKQNEIIVCENVSSEVHKYAKAAAIITQQGGAFSHAAIIFSELSIPSLTGCNLDSLKTFEGQMVYLRVSKEPKIIPLPKEMPNLQLLSLENGAWIEKQSHEVKQLLAHSFYQKVFMRLLPLEAVAFLNFPLAVEQFAIQKKKIKKHMQKLFRLENPLQQFHLFRSLERQINQRLKIAALIQPKEAAVIQEELINLQRNAHMLPKLPLSVFAKVSGKRQNLDLLQEVLPKLKLSKLILAIPSYHAWTDGDLLWKHYPNARKQVETVLSSTLNAVEKSQKIEAIISRLHIHVEVLGAFIQNISGPMIVRSSSSDEDQMNRSGAGMFTSVKAEQKEKLPDAIHEVLLSSFSEKAITYLGNSFEKYFNMEFIIQDYVADGHYSGVAFSVADRKKWNIAGIQIVQGLGGGVEGKGFPSLVYVDTKDGTIEDLKLDKGKKLPCDLDLAKEIAGLMKQLENECHTPVEIEFVGKGNQLSIVQLRPITLEQI